MLTNQVVLVGRLTKEIELKEYGKGKNAGSMARFSIAVRDGKDADGNERTQFISCVAWNATAETLEKYVAKGDMVMIGGRLTENNYTDDNDVKHYTLQVSVDQINLLPNPRNDQEEQPRGGKYHR